MNYKIILFLAILVPYPCIAGPTLGTREVLLDNEKVQVVRLTYPAGSESGMHTHEYATRTAYFVKGGKLEILSAKQINSATTITAKDGDIVYLPAATHNIKNVGTTEVVIIEHEFK